MLLGQDAGELTLTIDRTGAVALPELGLITVAGMSFEAAAELLREGRVAAERIGVQALMSMGRLRAINVMLAGEVRSLGLAPFQRYLESPTLFRLRRALARRKSKKH